MAPTDELRTRGFIRYHVGLEAHTEVTKVWLARYSGWQEHNEESCLSLSCIYAMRTQGIRSTIIYQPRSIYLDVTTMTMSNLAGSFLSCE